MIRLSGIGKVFGSLTALHELDLDLLQGRTTALLGPSGCGKSTILRIILGLIEPEQGRVEVDGTRVTAATAPGLRRRMGTVIQSGGLFPHLTGRENVTLLPRHLRLDPQRIESRLQELLGLTRLPPSLLDRYPHEVSGGQAQRLALMRALMLDPDILLLDEPLAALDPLVRAELRDDLGTIFRKLGKTVVLVTHDLVEAVELGDTIVLMREGRVVQEGGLKDLRAHPSDPFVTRFLGAWRGLE